MLDAALAGLLLVAQWPAIGYLILGVTIGLYFGAMPGLSGLVGLAILLPFTFGMDSGSAFALLLGMFAVTTTSDTIASVLLGIPGTVSSQATVLDGYPMAVRGEAARAFGAAFTVSALGGVIGALFLGLSIPIVRPLILSFASPEFFLLGVLGLTMVGSLSGGSIVKGMLAAVLGLMLSMIGYAEMGAIARYHFGFTYLLDGVPLIPLVLGLFAVPEILDLAIRGSSISRVPPDRTRGGITRGIRDAFRHKWLVLRCSAIGIYVGMLPGLGGAIVDWVAYGHAVQSAGDKSRFGKGDVRGVIAPETANNAMKGGALIPTVAFGIPGSAPMALILGALTIQGLTPGPQMLTTELYVTFGLVWILVIANILGAGVLMLCATQIARVTFIRGHLIIPAVVLFVFMGAWMSSNAIGDWVALLVFGLLGYLMKQGGLPRPPVILGFILGPIMENALFIT
ncbi:MAG TPA: tripartite tricarboxylate transporter permease, partial [Gammaproteobacteria bacterium]